MRTDIYLVETIMPGDLPPTRHYESGSGFVQKDQTAKFVGHTEGPCGSDSFVEVDPIV